MTGAWNDGIKKAVKEKFDKIIMISDDLIFNKSINYLIDEIKSDDAIYGGTSVPGGVLGNGPQVRNEPVDDIIDVSGECEPDKLPSRGHL